MDKTVIYPSITVVIHTYNEEKNIVECIDSAKLLTDIIIIVDMESKDKTVERAQSQHIPVVTFPFSYYVEPARAFGIQQAKTDWVFILDADERMTKELAEEIKHIITNEKNTTHNPLPTTHYKVPRKNIFGRIKWLKHGGWWPDHQLRLINKKYFKEWPDRIHSTPTIEGQMGYVQQPFLHYFHGDLEQMVNKTIVYEHIESDLLFKANRPVTTSTFFRKFLGELYRRLFKHAGFKDGTIGIIESIYQAFSKTITYLYLYEKYQRKETSEGRSV
jgi:glycosyltransferase involved in cell wall biosynthesis